MGLSFRMLSTVTDPFGEKVEMTPAVRVTARVLAFAERSARRVELHVLRRHNLRSSDWRIIATLVDAGATDAETVAHRTLLPEHTVMTHISDLVDRGLIIRGDRRSDDAARVLRLTEAGRRLHGVIQPMVVEQASREFATLSFGELEDLEAQLRACETRARFRLSPEPLDSPRKIRTTSQP